LTHHVLLVTTQLNESKSAMQSMNICACDGLHETWLLSMMYS